MATIKAPFNFVPVSENVFFPDWASKISQDVPFEEGESGCIEFEITAKSPIFVRNGHSQHQDKDNSFSAVENKYFIPATSIKGSIRNVLEIMSFGKMRVDRRARFAQREWDNSDLYPKARIQQSMLCGWLRRKGDTYEIVSCGKPYRIGHTQIDDYIKKRVHRCNVLANKFKKNTPTSVDLANSVFEGHLEYDPKTAAYKYALLENVELTNLTFSLDEESCNLYKDNRLKYDTEGDITGTIVLTGQPNLWEFPRPIILTNDAGKFYEFVFAEQEHPDKYPVSKEMFDHFKFIYTDSTEWNRTKNLLDGHGLPVFFRKENKNVKDFGLTFLYKLPYDYSPYNLLSKSHRSEKPDLAECIFGYTINSDFLKGRVQFSHAFSESEQLCNDKMIFTLGSPKASYYPIYIKQEGTDGVLTDKYATYNDGSLTGWKRYPIRKHVGNRKDEEEYNEALDSILYPVKQGSLFKGKVRFHNLRGDELGAILSALTFHNTRDCFHQIGQGKPFGLGKVHIKANLLGDLQGKEEFFMTKFEKILSEHCGGDWCNQLSVVNLFTMSREQPDIDEALLTYMNLDVLKGNNEFQNAKEAKGFLEYYLKLPKVIEFAPDSLYTLSMRQVDNAEKEIQEANRLEKTRLLNLYESFIREGSVSVTNGDFQSGIILFESASMLFPESRRHVDLINDAKKKLEEYVDKKANLLKTLAEATESGKINKFERIQKDVEVWAKKHKQIAYPLLPEDQWQYLKRALSKVYESNPKDPKWHTDNKYSYWNSIRKWIDDEAVQSWVKEILG